MTAIYVSRGTYAGYDVILKDAGVFEADANIDLNGNDIIGWDDLIGSIAGREIRNNASSMQLRMESGGVLDVVIDSVIEYTFAASTLDLGGNILSEVALIQGLTTTNKLDDTTSGWIINGPISCRISIGTVNQMQIADGNISVEDCFIDMNEQTLPVAPAANVGRLFCRDNGAGKTQLAIIFNTGVEQVIATQP